MLKSTDYNNSGETCRSSVISKMITGRVYHKNIAESGFKHTHFKNFKIEILRILRLI